MSNYFQCVPTYFFFLVKNKSFPVSTRCCQNGYEIYKSLENCETYVKLFSGAKISDISDYVKPLIQENPDKIIIYAGTNDLVPN